MLRTRGKKIEANRIRQFLLFFILFLIAISASLIFSQDAQSAQVTLAWDAPVNTENIVGYKIHYGYASGNYTQSIEVNNNVTEYTVSNLEEGITYYFATSSYDTNNYESEFSNEVFYPDGVNTYTLTATAGNGGTISPSTVTVNHGASQTFTISANTGYYIADVLVDNLSVGAVDSHTFTNVTSNHTIEAVFAINTYTLTAIAGNGGTISPSTVTVNHGASQTFTISANTGYHIFDVLVDGSSEGPFDSDTFTFTNVTSNHTIEAIFAQTASGSAEVTLAWDPPEDDSNVVGYILYYGYSTGDYVFSIDVGNVTEYTLTGLEYSTTYYAVVTAYDSDRNESVYSNEIVFTPEPNTIIEDSDGDGISDDDEISIYGTDPDNADTDGDGISDGDELELWVDSWNADIDGDGLINILDDDSDNDGFLDGFELLNDSDPADSQSTPHLEDVIEAGEVSIDHNWHAITFTKPFLNPVVVAKMTTYNDNDPAVVRIRNVNSTGFEIRIQEWQYLDDMHSEESVNYMVLEQGAYTLDDGTMVEAGMFETDNTNSFKVFSFNQTFNTRPVMITAITSFNEEDTVTGRQKSILTDSFRFYMEEQESNPQVHAPETISYIAWEPSAGIIDNSGTISNLIFEVQNTADNLGSNFRTIQFTETLTDVPYLLTDMQTTDGGDTANLRCQNLDIYGVDMKIDEERSNNNEIEHTLEVGGYILLLLLD